MNVNIKSFPDAGDAAKERIVLNVTTDGDIGKYLLFCTTKLGDGSPTAGRKQMYWFPDKPIKAGDLVVLYTKKGTRSEKKQDSGATVHFFYWGLEGSLWGDGKNVAVLMHSAEWSTAAPKKVGG